VSLGKDAGPDGPPSRQGRLGLMALFKSPSFCLGGGPLLFAAQRGAAAAANGPGGVQVDRRLCNVDAEPELGVLDHLDCSTGERGACRVDAAGYLGKR
jgi:hypothetical protein